MVETNKRSSARVRAVYEHLLAEYGLDAAESAELVGSLLKNLAELQDAIRQAAAAGKWAEVNHAGHSLKGVALNVGQQDLADVGIHIERVTKDPSAAPAAMPPLLAELDRIVHEFGLGCDPASGE